MAEKENQYLLCKLLLSLPESRSAADLDAAESHGLLTRRPSQTYYDGDDLVVLDAVARLARLGLEPRHLRVFVTAAEREASLVDQVVTPRQRAGDKAAAAETLSQLAALSVRLHTVLVRHRLRG